MNRTLKIIKVFCINKLKETGKFIGLLLIYVATILCFVWIIKFLALGIGTVLCYFGWVNEYDAELVGGLIITASCILPMLWLWIYSNIQLAIKTVDGDDD
tara:strand:- start:34438 stop:34737 length:300 start_codon:yes stop_codon:yes gene_type:complete